MDTTRARAMLEAMAGMQEEHNLQVHPQWAAQGYAYYRAIWVECAEMLDHFGWKWWKAQSRELAQVKLELVDIWHFALSEMLRDGRLSDTNTVAAIAEALSGVEADADPDAERFRLAIEALAVNSLQTTSFTMAPFIAAMQALPLSYQELFELYIGKNVLNRFRQDNGYKAGTYVKSWGGREDNEHLVEALAELACPPETIADELYTTLQSRYASLTS